MPFVLPAKLMTEQSKQESRALQVPCIFCDAKPGDRCTQPGRVEPLLGGFHAQRIELAKKLVPIYPSGMDLDATDKALICYYAYILLSNSVSANSEKMFGKQFTTEEIQREFAKRAVDVLRADGLLKK
jgi:hypothetical protein